MVTVVKAGELEPKPIKCTKCNSELSYIPCDIHEQLLEYLDRDGDVRVEWIYHIVCPVCNQRITVTRWY